MAKIIFYTEAIEFGGHERMALTAHKALRESCPELSISWIVNRRNHRLGSELDAAGLEHLYVDFSAPHRSTARSLAIGSKKIGRLAKMFRQSGADLIVFVQGGITGSILGILAARVARMRICSYIPMAHSPRELNLHRLQRVREIVLRIVYRLIRRFITIDSQQAMRIRKAFPNAQVIVVENVISEVTIPRTPRPDVRQHYGIPDCITLGVIARVEFAQKRQDWLVHAVSTDAFYDDKAFVLVGDGPDSERLASKIERSPHRDRMFLLGWSQNANDIYSAIDVLVIPSRAEGVPLVMLEALARGIPVVGTDRDGMRSWLPESWQFPFEDISGLTRALRCALAPARENDWEQIRERLKSATDHGRFAGEFCSALRRFSRV